MRRALGPIVATALVAGLTSFATIAPAQAGPSLLDPVAAPKLAGSGWKPRAATFEEAVTRDVPVRMSDGTTLYVDVYQPADPKTGKPVARRFPVILTQTPYNKSVLSFHSPYLVTRGYVQVVADVRGTGSSGGSWSSFGARERRDGYELANWATSKSRPWSNGRLGLWGTSYGAIAAMLTAAQQPRGLRASFPVVPAADVYRDVAVSGGALDVGFIPMWLGLVTTAGLVPPAYTSTAPDAGLATVLDHLLGGLDLQLPLLLSALTGDDRAYDTSWYRERSPITSIGRVKVPTFIVGGEYDLFQRGEPMLFNRLQKNGVPTKLLLGPWEHAATDPSLALSSLNPLGLRWFDHYIRGVRDPALDKDIRPVTYYEQGPDRWRTASRWLGADVHAKAFKLSGSASPGSPGVLTRGRPSKGADPIVPMPVNGLCTRSSSQWTAGLVQGNPCDDDNATNDLTGNSYRTAPLERTVKVLGPINARLYVSSTSTDGMLSVQVEDVAPGGRITRLTGGWQVLSHRALTRSKTVRRDGQIVQPYHPFSKAAQVAMTPGTVAAVDVEVFPTGAAIRKGHRLQITVQAFDVPHLLPSLPSLIGSLGLITVHHSSTYPSRLVIPVRR